MKSLLLSLALTTCISSAFSADINNKNNQHIQNKILVQNFWNALFNEHKIAVIDELVDEKYIQHNPSFKDGKNAFKNGMEGFLKEFPKSSAKIKNIGSDDDLVFIHNHIKLNENDKGQAAVDIFRVKDGKIVEHWDVIQDIPEKSENQNTMF
ncbi:nuclear transport factor 2 family protein [Campylobacter mucosalis]|uniref:SnoaL-like domain protein n=1 Tax=Campylobacter mucosalis CCUG 21559 TaxID=1032067 RepID=A0A6G5QHQ4_9BACT|nr:ester cyclase [Campylobacter mucosalis]KEA46371.1 pyruvate kinase [Campylobacter mucosalis]QCD45233.1 SnoaL-like domain protein [Campylobacter mucosalis CCUG 21559]QKF63147.1 putative SnoaL-like aldol condensation-catalyzing enzyme [Campylobacter mucosalis]